MKKRKFNEDKVLILNSSPKIGEVPVRAEEYDLSSKHFLLGHQRPLTPSNLRGGNC